jgi:carbamate kinase
LIALELAPYASRGVACVLTHARVDPEDEAFRSPTKPIGRFYSRDEARQLERERGWQLVEDAGRGWRRTVPSPRPIALVEVESVRRVLDAGGIAIACGGGGIPVVARDGRLDGVDAVIDKDLASTLLGRALGAERLVILTDVDALYTGFRTERERALRTLSLDQAEALLPELAAGSMRPKVEAAAAFARDTGGTAVITSADALERALAGEAGTRIAR